MAGNFTADYFRSGISTTPYKRNINNDYTHTLALIKLEKYESEA